MADRRMIHRNVVTSDEYITMSYEAQSLYIQFTIEADAYGFVGGVQKIMRSIGVNSNHFAELVNSRFIIPFETGCIVLTHWNLANTRRADRTDVARFPDELSQVTTDANKVYRLVRDNGMPLSCQAVGNGMPNDREA